MARLDFLRSASAKDEFNDYVLEPPKLHPVALHGVLGDMADAACANSEAVPVAVALHILARFAAMLGRSTYIQVADERRHLRMNALIVGPTSKGRKGTSAAMPRVLFEQAQLKAGYLPVRELTSISTGEGLIHQVRDPYRNPNAKDSDPGDPGVSDKRLYCNISEFASVLIQANKDTSILSTVLRDAFDGGVLTTPSKTSFCQASDTHIIVVGSVPDTEIYKRLSDTEKTNGFANRFPMFYTLRPKLNPSPKPTDPYLMNEFSNHIASAAKEAWAHTKDSGGLIGLKSDAELDWRSIYEQIETKEHSPQIASLLGRQSLYTLIFAALLALLNRKQVISMDEIFAALAWMEYWEKTVEFIFMNSDQKERAAKMALLKDEIVGAIGALPGKQGMPGEDVTWTDIAGKVTHNYQRHNAKSVKEALEQLLRESPPRIHSRTLTTGGRPANLYSLGAAGDGADASE